MKKVILLMFFIVSPVYAEDCDFCTLDQKIEVASKQPVMESKLGKSVEYLDSYLLDESKPEMAVDALQEIPGVFTKHTGGFGSISTIRLRGARAIDTKVLLNGIQVSDASDVQASAIPFLEDMTMDGIEHIEVMKGASSSVHGSSAIGGVVDFEGKFYDKEAINYTSEVGSFSTTKDALELATHGIYLYIARLDSDGITTHDNYQNTTIYSSYKFENDKIKLMPFLRATKVEGMLHNAPFILNGMFNKDDDGGDNRRDYGLYTYGNTLVLSPTESFSITDKTGLNNTYRRFEFLPNSDGTGFYADGSYWGDDFTNDISATWNGLTLGWFYKKDTLQIRSIGIDHRVNARQYSDDYYGEYKTTLYDTNVLLGVREATDEFSKSRLIWDMALEHQTPIGNLTSHYGTAYRIPSPYEQHGAFISQFGLFAVGNPSLSPERAQTFDIGLSQEFNHTVSVGVTSFYSQLTNRIDFVGLGYQNVEGTSSIDGLEAYYEQFLFGCATARIAYTLTNHAQVDVPQNEIQGSIRFEKGKWKGSIRGTYVGVHKMDVFSLDDFLVDRINESAYSSLDATLSYTVNKNVEVYGKITNLFDNTYQVAGYGQPRFEAYCGVKIAT